MYWCFLIVLREEGRSFKIINYVWAFVHDIDEMNGEQNNFMDDLELHDAIVLIHAESIFNPHVYE